MSAESPEPPNEPQGQPSGQEGQPTGDELTDRLTKLGEQITAHLEGLRKK
ncbi:hypothetical protein [Streptomyces aidingensis]|uniref:Uncharacterized protein n=1 Tax=Streptomyces aidingensis TaxID=910347 RepID=A0A1I1KBU0_9ACTN|nr:hypothetical protein [Streptomyces aidingensis]SFC55543.1 hypothetical protein SAMN05421773_10477 [Streptomyces aidingensis]